MYIVCIVIIALLVCVAAFALLKMKEARGQVELQGSDAARMKDEINRLNDELRWANDELRRVSAEKGTAESRCASLTASLAASQAVAESKEHMLEETKQQFAERLSQQQAAADSRLKEQERNHAAMMEQLERKQAVMLSQQEEKHTAMLNRQEERFKNLAGEIMDANAKRFNETSSQKINDLLSPLKENIENFRKAVGEAYNNESRERFSLQRELRELLELNKTIGREARDLTRALRSDSKMQGDWGEMILEKLLEKSGLQKGVHFEEQVTRDVDGSKLIGEDGRSLRADVVVYYPDDRCLVIDSKVSLSGFVDYINLSDDDSQDADGLKRKEAAQRHLTSVRNHINELSHKNYQDLIGKKRMDFVMMFIPNEAAYIAAMQIEPGLWQEAYDKRVLMVSPTQLISVLRMLRQLWKQDAVNRNVEEIARLSGRLLDKFTGMMDAFDDVERHLSNTQKAYTTLRSRLSDGAGNVFVTARKIQELGAKSTKKLPEK